ncbi:hypothetical protein BCR34DRAFT_208141 [Clohesyomyces aquaticus]|uniref:Uncharacterized protein n=1 Tax=Clohesyomyces aquaticus TaxID=1231657 RepID=A0A1Y2A9L9_9PLEO|nr:hypothetical protein BCR34DRAFT_208141 [Clohesyomyces aquaticus]
MFSAAEGLRRWQGRVAERGGGRVQRRSLVVDAGPKWQARVARMEGSRGRDCPLKQTLQVALALGQAGEEGTLGWIKVRGLAKRWRWCAGWECNSDGCGREREEETGVRVSCKGDTVAKARDDARRIMYMYVQSHSLRRRTTHCGLTSQASRQALKSNNVMRQTKNIGRCIHGPRAAPEL